LNPLSSNKIGVIPIFTILLGSLIIISSQSSPAFAATYGINIPAGVSVPECEKTNSCFYPYEQTIDAGDEIIWFNDDSAAHTVTSGTAKDGADGNFDSGLFMPFTKYTFVFNEPGNYPYLCMVHPWMTGEINVKSSAPPTPTGPPITVYTDRSSYRSGDTIRIFGEVSDLLSGTLVSLQVFAANGNIVVIEQIDINPDKTFSTEISAGGSLWQSQGTYIVKVLYGTQSRNAETTFEFSGSVDYGLRNTIAVDDTNFMIYYKITGGSILSVIPDDEANSLKSTIRTTSNGVLTITLPRSLIDAKINEQDDNFFVLINGDEVEFDEHSSDTDRTLTIAFPYGSKEIEIIGSYISYKSSSYYPSTPTQSSPSTFKSYADTGSSGPNDPSQIYSINVIDAKYSIDYRKSTGNVLSATANGESNSIILRFYTSNDGQITITLPRELIDSKINGRDDNFFVLLDGEEVDISETKTSYARTLIIPFSANTDQIEIIGSSVNVNTPPPAPVPTPIDYPTPTRSGSDVILAVGSSVPGCEETKSCYIPYQITVKSGGEVTWYNADSAAHTVTSGTGKDGPDGNFDSSLFMAGTTFSVKFDNYGTGTYPYFCMVHPWMTGEVIVVNDGSQSVPVPTPIPKPVPKPAVPPSPPAWTDVILGDGTSVPGCEVSNSCFIPSTLTINLGENVVWFNQDSAAHTVTSGTPQDGPDGEFDSSLFMAGQTFSHTFVQGGTYDYFCMVHPWMIGQVIVSGSETIPVTQPVSNPTTEQNEDDLSKIIEENKKLRDELDRQGEQINNLNKQVDYLSEIINSIKGFFGSIFS